MSQLNGGNGHHHLAQYRNDEACDIQDIEGGVHEVLHTLIEGLLVLRRGGYTMKQCVVAQGCAFALVQVVQQWTLQHAFSQVESGVSVGFTLQPLTLENAAFLDFGVQALGQLFKQGTSMARRYEAHEEVQVAVDEHPVAQCVYKHFDRVVLLQRRNGIIRDIHHNPFCLSSSIPVLANNQNTG